MQTIWYMLRVKVIHGFAIENMVYERGEVFECSEEFFHDSYPEVRNCLGVMARVEFQRSNLPPFFVERTVFELLEDK